MTSSSPHSYSETMAHDTISRVFRKKTLTHPRFGSLPSSIPLIIPNDCVFDISADDGETLRSTEGVKREGLKVVEEALDLLKAIDKPVGVLSICGPCRSGKSYVLSRMLGTGDAFELGHTLDPKTFGIWMGTTILECDEFALLLLDTEGIDAAHATARDDASILVMTILLSSYLIYNSLGSPKRTDLQKMSCFLKLSEGIAIRNTTKSYQKSTATNDDEDDDCEDENEDLVLFRQHFPDFLWLLRDVHLVPVDEEGVPITPTEYLKTRVLKDSQSFKSKAKKSDEIARAILTYFPTVESRFLPPPSTKQEVMQQIAHNETSLSEEFNKGVESLVTYLLSVVRPNRGFVAGRLITGALLAELACEYVKHINDPSAVPRLEATWYSVIEQRCNDVIKKLIIEYTAEMSEEISSVGLPMEEEVYIEEAMTKQRPVTLFDLHRKIFSQKTNALLDQVGQFLSGVTAEDDGSQITKKGILQELSDQLAIVKETEEKYGDKKIMKKEVSGGALLQFWLQNINESERACKRCFDELYAPIKDRATSNDPNYTFDVLLKELTEMMETYYVQAVGPAKWMVGEDGRVKVESEKALFRHIRGFQEKVFKDAQEAAKVKAQQEELNAKVLSLQAQMKNDAEQQRQIIERMQEEHRKDMEASRHEEIRRQTEEQEKYRDFMKTHREEMAEITKRNNADMKKQHESMMQCMQLQGQQQAKTLETLTAVIKEANKPPPPPDESGGSCFAPGTQITLSNGCDISIEKQVEGVKLLALGGVITTITSEFVENPYPVGSKLFGINDDEPFAALHHPFFTTEGWKCLDPTVANEENPNDFKMLQVGDIVFNIAQTNPLLYKPVMIRRFTYKTITEAILIYGLHLNGPRSYHANGYAVYANYPVLTKVRLREGMKKLNVEEEERFTHAMTSIKSELNKVVGKWVGPALTDVGALRENDAIDDD